MFTLNQEEDELLLKNADPKIAAVALKLKKAEDDAEFIPRTRLAKEISEKKELDEKLKVIEATKKADEEKRLKEIEDLNNLLKTREGELNETKTKFDEEKKVADSHRNYHKSVVESLKKNLGDDFLPEYENFSLDSLHKIANSKKVDVDNGKGSQHTTSDLYTREQLNNMSQAEMQANLDKVNRSVANLK